MLDIEYSVITSDVIKSFDCMFVTDNRKSSVISRIVILFVAAIDFC